MFKQYLDDYYKSKINVKEICKLTDSSPTSFRRYLKKNGLVPRQEYLKRIDTGIDKLNQTLRDRYSSIVNRCNGKTTDHYGHYKGKPYMPVYEWVEFCNQNKELLVAMWSVYEINNRSSKYAVSVDRHNNNSGYTKDNIQFVTHGFNSWKRILNPVKVCYQEETNYFMSCEEASQHYGLRRQTIGECLNGSKYHTEYITKLTTINEVLHQRGINDLETYYKLSLYDEAKKWDKRKRKR